MSMEVNVMRQTACYEMVPLKILGATLMTAEQAETLIGDRLARYYNGWWTRTPGLRNFTVAYVDNYGSLNSEGVCPADMSLAIRPVLLLDNIDFAYSVFNIGDIFTFGSVQFIILSSTIAFCTEDIGTMVFKNDTFISGCNDYNLSEVKLAVDEWFSAYVDTNIMSGHKIVFADAGEENSFLLEVVLNGHGTHSSTLYRTFDSARTELNRLVDNLGCCVFKGAKIVFIDNDNVAHGWDKIEDRHRDIQDCYFKLINFNDDGATVKDMINFSINTKAIKL